MEKSFLKSNLLAISIFFGLLSLGYFIFIGIKTFSDKDRIVSVKGLAEMKIKAESSNIVIQFGFSGDELNTVIDSVDSKRKSIEKYLNSTKNIKNIVVQDIDVIDNERYYEQRWEDGKYVDYKIDRYEVKQNIVIKSIDVEKTENIKAKIELDLIKSRLTSKLYTNYTFPKLNEIKPKLIAESTKNARISGEQFAKDSKSKLGKIKTATQGQIVIGNDYSYENENENNNETTESFMQKVKVISHIVFFLE